jgi:hypothetical protein
MKLGEIAAQAVMGMIPLGEKWSADDFGPSLLFGKLGKRTCIVRNIFRKTKICELVRFDINDDDFSPSDGASLLADVRKALEPFLVSRGDLVLEGSPEGFIVASLNEGLEFFA